MRLFLSPGYPYEQTLQTFHNQTSIIMCSFLPYFSSFNRTKGKLVDSIPLLFMIVIYDRSYGWWFCVHVAGGLIQLNHGRPQPLQYVVNAAFLATLYSDYLDAADTPGWYCGPNFYSTNELRKFAQTQVCMIPHFSLSYKRNYYIMNNIIPNRHDYLFGPFFQWKNDIFKWVQVNAKTKIAFKSLRFKTVNAGLLT